MPPREGRTLRASSGNLVGMETGTDAQPAQKDRRWSRFLTLAVLGCATFVAHDFFAAYLKVLGEHAGQITVARLTPVASDPNTQKTEAPRTASLHVPPSMSNSQEWPRIDKARITDLARGPNTGDGGSGGTGSNDGCCGSARLAGGDAHTKSSPAKPQRLASAMPVSTPKPPSSFRPIYVGIAYNGGGDGGDGGVNSGGDGGDGGDGGGDAMAGDGGGCCGGAGDTGSTSAKWSTTPSEFNRWTP